MAKKQPSPSQTNKGRRGPVNDRKYLSRTWLQALIILVFGAALSAVIVYQPRGGQILHDVAVGEPAPRDIRATHTFTIIREDTTGLEAQRDEAAERVPPVWDFDTTVAEEVSGRIGEVFESMRRFLRQEAEEQLSILGVESEHPTAEGTGASAPDRAADPLTILSEAQRERVGLSHRTEMIRTLQAGLDPEAVRALAQEGFTTETENALKRLVSEVLTSPVVHSLAVLQAERDDGVTLRTIRADSVVNEATRRDFSEFVDQESALERLNELTEAQLPADMPAAVETALVNVARELVRANVNTRFNSSETASRRAEVRAAIEPETETHTINSGDLILHAGQPVSEADFEIVRVMQRSGDRSEESRANEVVIGGVIYVLLIIVGVFAYGMRFVRRFKPTFKDLAFLTTTLFVMVGLTKIIMMLALLIGDRNPGFPHFIIYAAIPFAAGGVVVRLVLNAEHALIYSIVYSLLVALILPDFPLFAAFALVGSLMGIGASDVCTTRMALFRAGLLVGLVNMLFAAAIGMLSSRFLDLSTLALAGFGLLGGLFVAILATALLPLVESSFHYITDIKLLELANPNHAAIRELLLRAPGSYQHSMMVGSLVEAGCKAIGAHALLGRVGAYYHDIGKAKNPRFYAENQSGKNPHDKLKPHMSALVIKAHVKDGIETARTFGLPEEIVSFIPEHHGTRLISFFYHKAKEQLDPDIQGVDEEDFRYPGPKPQSPETAICMLADGIEAAARSMQDPSPARLQGLVQTMINTAFTDGQLDECDLTLRDLDAIAREFIRVLGSIYHHRPEYPDQKKQVEQKKPAEPKKSAEQKRFTSTEKLYPVPTAKEGSDDSGDSSPLDSGEEPAEPESVRVESQTTLRRLGIDQSRAVDTPNRRQRD